eukprot:jgi/Ulvmu1/9235/UM005_0335.1
MGPDAIASAGPKSLDSPRYDPFRRADSFGKIGEGPLSRRRTAAFWVRTAILVPPRALACLALSLTMRGICLVSTVIPATRRFLIAPGAMAISRSLLFMLGFLHIRHQRFLLDPDRCEGPKSSTNRHAVPIVVSNHVSWLDILLLQYLYSAAYVTRAETSKTPIVGGVCDALPCIYVNREKQQTPDSSHALRTTTDKIVERARLKWQNPQARLRPLAIFPEGTTTNGQYILPFRTGAFVAGVPVQPVLLRYPQHKGNPALSWETVRAPRHIHLVMSSFLHSAQIFELPMYHPDEEEQSDPRLYADNVRQYMLKWGNKLGLEMKESDSGYEDKKEYHRLLRASLGISS